MVHKFAAAVAAALNAMTASVKAMGTADFAGRTGFLIWRGSLVRRVRDESRPRSAMDRRKPCAAADGPRQVAFWFDNFIGASSSARR